MATTIKERYTPIPIGVNGTGVITGDTVGGFLCVTTGTLTLTRVPDLDNSLVKEIITNLPVTAGVYYPIPYYLGSKGGTVTLAGGASGVLGV